MANQVTEAPEPGRSPQPECREMGATQPMAPSPKPRGHSSKEGRGQTADPEDRAPVTEGLASCRWEL